jgi:membrane-associated phospholipid phosphatase
MHHPRDHHAAARVGTIWVARIFSNIVSPPVMFALLGLALALYERPLWPALAWAALYGFFVSLTPILFILYLLRTGRIGELHMSNTAERHLPYLVALLCAVFALALFILLDGPELLRCLLIFNVIELAALGLINVYWLISIHATGIMATMLIVALVFGRPAALLILPVVVLVMWVRLFLRRHTMSQVVAGLGLGVISVQALVWMGCFR